MAQASLYSAHYTGGVPSVGYSHASYTATGAAEIPTGQRMITGGTAGGERVQSTRKVSSTIINEQYLGPTPQDLPTKEIYVQGPPVEEVKYVTRKEVREVEKRVPKYEYEWVEKIVEIPRIEYVEKKVDKIQYVDKIVEKKVLQRVEVPQDVIREVKVPKVRYVEKVVEVPGEVISVPKPYVVEQPALVTQYHDVQVPLVVAQTIRPFVVEGHGVHEVDVYEYEPECVPVDVHVIKPVASQMLAAGAVETLHRVITVPAAQYNTMLQQLNVHLSEVERQKLPFLTSANGQVTILQERINYAQPQAGIIIQGWSEAGAVRVHKETAATTVTTTAHSPSVSISNAYMPSGMVGAGVVNPGLSSYYSSGPYMGGSFATTGPVYQQATTTTTNYPAGLANVTNATYGPVETITRPAIPLAAH